MVGQQLGKRKLFDKTLEGTLVCLASCLITGIIFYYGGLDIPWLVILTGALVATFVELIPIPVNDNLAMPLAAGAVMVLMRL